MYCVGLTGNIASGKSSALKWFQQQGVCTLSADVTAKTLTAPHKPAYHAIVSHFGHEMVLQNGQLNRPALRARIFNDNNAKRWLEDLLHPLIRDALQENLQSCTGPYCVIEIPLLISRDPYPYLNRVLAVIAPKPLLIKRLMQRDHCTHAEASAILRTQPTLKQRLTLADDVLVNKGGFDEMEQQLMVLHTNYTHTQEDE